MSGKRILDAIALLRASRNIAYNHFAIRLSQVELYSKTSSLLKAFRAPPNAANFSQASAVLQNRGGIHEDHSYKAGDGGSADPKPRHDLKVGQTQAERYPLPDGTIPPADGPGQESGDPETRYASRSEPQYPLEQDSGLQPEASSRSSIPNPSRRPPSPEDAKIAQRQSENQIPKVVAEPPDFKVDQEQDTYYQPPDAVSPVLSALPRVKLPQVENDVQAGDSHIKDNINADVFYAGAENAEPSEEQLAQLFHSRKGSALGKKAKYAPDGVRKYHTTARLCKSDDTEVKGMMVSRASRSMGSN